MDKKCKQRCSGRHRSHFGKLVPALRWDRRCCAFRCLHLCFRQSLLGPFPFLQYFYQKLRPAGHRCFVLVLLLPRRGILECIPKVGRAFAAIAIATPIALVAALGWQTACQGCPTGIAAGDQIRRYHRRSRYGHHGLILLDLPRGTDLTAHGPIVQSPVGIAIDQTTATGRGVGGLAIRSAPSTTANGRSGRRTKEQNGSILGAIRRLPVDYADRRVDGAVGLGGQPLPERNEARAQSSGPTSSCCRGTFRHDVVVHRCRTAHRQYLANRDSA